MNLFIGGTRTQVQGYAVFYMPLKRYLFENAQIKQLRTTWGKKEVHLLL